ncbi:hypothetical protein DYB30_014377 [Aphanomyces astaci]|uniref:DDE-1 domain-containing protein n=1 Tax=Aphanomyces astaci TaxID=112090 RepID=A0A397E860_APHAT|nr:hypothetical protein DYB38_014309 [Aphanomyces astaci]RHY78099.1 hypothetical protein DYB30_014377 [Aphanomyces astaci]RHZ34075.1 hypothetical protein DYB31_013819 [Aphanomyces astaci]
MATILPREYEEQLARWVNSMRQDGVPVTPQMIQIMALETAIDAGLDEASFAVWIQKTLRAVVACPHQVRPGHVRERKMKDRATAMVMADSTGKKHPLFLVLKTAASTIKAVVQENLTQRHGFGKQVWKDVQPLQDRFGCIYGNPTAWWNSTISMDFLRYHFAGRPDRATKKVLLLWDDSSAHFTDEVVAIATELNVLLEKIPPQFTWICQPADVAWMRPMKAQLQKMWIDSIRRAEQQGSEDDVQVASAEASNTGTMDY